MKTNTKMLCLMLAAMTVGGTMISCGGDASGAVDTTASVGTDAATEAVTEEISELEQLPAADYGGHVVNILLNDQDERFVDIMTEGEETGDVMNDIIYQRNRAVEEKYNVTIVGESDTYDNVNNMLKKEVQGGLTDHDFYFSNCYAAPLASGGFLYVLNDLPNVDLSNPWWDKAALEGMSVSGKVYLATGDISPTSLLTSSCLVFNKKLFSNSDMEFPYEMAANGTWTLDKLVEMTKGLTTDVNGDGKYTLGDDIFGFSSWMCDSPYSLFFGAGGRYSAKDAEDVPYVNFDMERISDIYSKMYQLILEQESYFVTDPNQYPTTYECFSNGGAYFCEITLQKIDAFLRDMEDDYGILPIPKWSAEQEDYLSCVNGAGGFVVIPNNPADAERTGMLFEALAAGAYDMVTPQIYEVITKTKNVRDEESADMVNLIIRNRVYDPFYINLCTGYDTLQTQLSSKKEEVASAMEKKLTAAEKAMQKIIDAYAEME